MAFFSHTLQSSNQVISSGDVIGILAYAASNESSNGDARLISGSIESVAEGDFTAVANPASLVFSTSVSADAVEQMRLTSEGYLGINTQYPASQLHVVGSTTIDGSATISAAATGRNLTIGGNADFSAAIQILGSGMSGSTEGLLIAESNAGAAYIYQYENAPIYFATAGAYIGGFSNNGGLMLGTSTNTYGTGSAVLYATGTPRIKLQNFTTGTTSSDGSDIYLDFADLIITNKEAAGDLILKTADVDRIYIQNDGNVGIGISSPLYELDVAGQTRITPGSAEDAMYIGRGSGKSSIKASAADASSQYLVLDSNGNDLLLNFYSSDDIVANYGGGNFVIGQTNALAKFHVTGANDPEYYTAVFQDSTSYAQDVGAGIVLRGAYTSGGTQGRLGGIKSGKLNSSDGDANSYLSLQYNDGSTLVEGVRIQDDSIQIRNPLLAQDGATVQYTAGTWGLKVQEVGDSTDGIQIGDAPFDSRFQAIGHTSYVDSDDYIIATSGTDTYISARTGDDVIIRGGGNDDTYQIRVASNQCSVGNGLLQIVGGETRFNPANADQDVTFEGVADTQLLAIDAGLDKVAIGTNPTSVSEKLTVNGSISNLYGWTTQSRSGSTTGQGVDNGFYLHLSDGQDTTLQTNSHYFVQMTTFSTGSRTGASYLAWYESSNATWYTRAIGQAQNVSNSPLLTEVSGQLRGHTDHASGYSIRYNVSTYYTNEADSRPHSMGANYHWQRLTDDLYYNDGNVAVNSGNLTVGDNLTLHSDDTGLIQHSNTIYAGTPTALDDIFNKYQVYNDGSVAGGIGISTSNVSFGATGANINVSYYGASGVAFKTTAQGHTAFYDGTGTQIAYFDAQDTILNFGTTAGTAGTVNKLALYDGGAGSMAGFGVSAGSINIVTESTIVQNYYAAGVKRMTINNGGVVVNGDVNATTALRVMGGTDTELLYTDPVNDRVGIGYTGPQEKLHVDGNIKATNTDGSNTSSLIAAAGTNQLVLRAKTSAPYNFIGSLDQHPVSLGSAGYEAQLVLGNTNSNYNVSIGANPVNNAAFQVSKEAPSIGPSSYFNTYKYTTVPSGDITALRGVQTSARLQDGADLANYYAFSTGGVQIEGDADVATVIGYYANGAAMNGSLSNYGIYSDIASGDVATYGLYIAGTAENFMSRGLQVSEDKGAIGSDYKIDHVENCQFGVNAAAQAGYIKIRLPAHHSTGAKWTNTMLMFDVDIYNYSTINGGGKGKRFTFGGYTYGTTEAWIHTTASCAFYDKDNEDDDPWAVRFIQDPDGYPCILIYKSSSGHLTRWDYPQVTISNVRSGFGSFSFEQWSKGWETSLETSSDLAGYTNSVFKYISVPLTNLQPEYNLYAGGNGAANNFTNHVVIDGTQNVFNENGENVDFRVEGDTQPNLLFCDASTDRIGIGTSSPDVKFQVEEGVVDTNLSAARIVGDIDTNSSGYTTTLALRGTDVGGSAALHLGGYSFASISASNDTNGVNSAGKLQFSTRPSASAPTVKMTLDKDGNLGIGHTGPQEKLHVDGNILLAGVVKNVTNASTAEWLESTTDSVQTKRVTTGASPATFWEGIDDQRWRIASDQGGYDPLFDVDYNDGQVNVHNRLGVGVNAIITNRFNVNAVGDGAGTHTLFTGDDNSYLSVQNNGTGDYLKLGNVYTTQTFLGLSHSDLPNSTYMIMSRGTDTFVSANAGYSVYVRGGGNNSAAAMRIGTSTEFTGPVVFNEAGSNYDFRVEGDTDEYLLFADANKDSVLIGTSTDGGVGSKLNVFQSYVANTTIVRTQNLYGQCSSTVNGTYYQTGLNGRVEKHLASGVTDGGYSIAANFVPIVFGAHATLAELTALRCNPSFNVASTGCTVNNMYGLKIVSYDGGVDNTIINNYGVYIPALTTATNSYGIYQAGDLDTNIFKGNMEIGSYQALPLDKYRLSVLGPVYIESTGGRGEAVTFVSSDTTGPGFAKDSKMSLTFATQFLGGFSLVNKTNPVANDPTLATNNLLSFGTDNVSIGTDTGLFGSFVSKFKVYTDTGAVEINEEYTLPTTDGSANQVLTTDGSGQVSWSTSTAPQSQSISSESPIEMISLTDDQPQVLSDTPASSPANLTFGTQSEITSSSFTHSTTTDSHKITLISNGVYTITYQMSFLNASNNRVVLGAGIAINGVGIPSTFDYGYSRALTNGGRAAMNGTYTVTLSAGDEISAIGWETHSPTSTPINSEYKMLQVVKIGSLVKA